MIGPETSRSSPVLLCAAGAPDAAPGWSVLAAESRASDAKRRFGGRMWSKRPHRHRNRRDEGKGGIRRRGRQGEGGDQLVDGEAGHGVGITE